MATALDNMNAATKGAVGQKIRDLRVGGATFDEIATALAADGIRLSRETIRLYVNEQRIPKGVPA